MSFFSSSGLAVSITILIFPGSSSSTATGLPFASFFPKSTAFSSSGGEMTLMVYLFARNSASPSSHFPESEKLAPSTKY